jgi:Uma2 family endonuclease
MGNVEKHSMTVDEFLAWAEQQEGRFELHRGQVYAMSPSDRNTRSPNSRFRPPWQTPSGKQDCRALFIRTA